MSFFPPINISKTQPIYFFTSLYVEVSRYQTLSIFSDVISDQMSLVAVRMTSFSSFLSCLPLSKWNSCKSLETLLFNIATSDFPSFWQNVMYPLKQSFRFLLIWVGPYASDLIPKSLAIAYIVLDLINKFIECMVSYVISQSSCFL